MDKRRIAPTFMLPGEFPNPAVNDIYVVFIGGVNNVHITSSHDFNHLDYLLGKPVGNSKNNSVTFGVRDFSLIDRLLNELVERNNGYVDWTMVVQQGQRAYSNLRRYLQDHRGVGDIEAILRFTKEGDIYLPRKEKR